MNSLMYAVLSNESSSTGSNRGSPASSRFVSLCVDQQHELVVLCPVLSRQLYEWVDNGCVSCKSHGPMCLGHQSDNNIQVVVEEGGVAAGNQGSYGGG